MVARLTLGLLLLLVSFGAAAQFEHRHAAWTSLPKKHVVVIDGGKESRVRYADFALDHGALNAYLATLSAVSGREFAAWSKPRQLAFLINAYNAHMIELILTRYPDIRSVWDFGKIFNNPFKKKFFMLLGRESSLDQIEHDTIRAAGVYDEPRIHFEVIVVDRGGGDDTGKRTTPLADRVIHSPAVRTRRANEYRRECRSGEVMAGASRSPLAPELPTLAESGLPGFNYSSYFAFVAPAATSPQIRELLSREIVRVIERTETRAQL